MKLLETIYIVFVLKFVYEVNNNLFPMVVCYVKTQSSADPTMNAELDCMQCAVIEVNIQNMSHCYL